MVRRLLPVALAACSVEGTDDQTPHDDAGDVVDCVALAAVSVDPLCVLSGEASWTPSDEADTYGWRLRVRGSDVVLGSGTTTNTALDLEVEAQGHYTLDVRPEGATCRDGAGPWASATFDALGLEAPTLSGVDARVCSEEQDIQCVEHCEGLAWRIDGGAWTRGAPPGDLSLGDHTVEARQEVGACRGPMTSSLVRVLRTPPPPVAVAELTCAHASSTVRCEQTCDGFTARFLDGWERVGTSIEQGLWDEGPWHWTVWNERNGCRSAEVVLPVETPAWPGAAFTARGTNADGGWGDVAGVFRASNGGLGLYGSTAGEGTFWTVAWPFSYWQARVRPGAAPYLAMGDTGTSLYVLTERGLGPESSSEPAWTWDDTLVASALVSDDGATHVVGTVDGTHGVVGTYVPFPHLQQWDDGPLFDFHPLAAGDSSDVSDLIVVGRDSRTGEGWAARQTAPSEVWEAHPLPPGAAPLEVVEVSQARLVVAGADDGALFVTAFAPSTSPPVPSDAWITLQPFDPGVKATAMAWVARDAVLVLTNEGDVVTVGIPSGTVTPVSHDVPDVVGFAVGACETLFLSGGDDPVWSNAL